MTMFSAVSLPLLFEVAVALFVLRLVGTSIYRIWFHPLKDYPGPKLAAVTSLYLAYKIVTGDQVRFEKQLHDQYGDVVRIRPDRLSFISPEAWKDIAGHRTGGRLENSKDLKFYLPEANGSRTIVSVEDPRQHAALRKIFSNAFSDKALKLQEPIIRQYVDQLVKNIKSDTTNNPETHLDAVKLYNCTTFDIMGDLTFGEPLGLLQQSQYTPWVEAVFAGIKAGTFLQVIQEYLPLGNLLVKFMPGLRQKRLEHFNHSAIRVDKRLAKGTDIDKPDFWKLVLEKGKDKLPLPEMHAHGSIFMIAGTETTATLLSGLTYLLLINPAKMKKVVEEVRALPSEDLSLERLPQLPYLNACFEEGLRMYPPVATSLPRVVPPGGTKIADRWVPGKTRVAVPQYAAYYSERNFTRPNSFEPERWLPGHVGYEEDRREVLQPFSTGPRNCLGKNLAYHEMRLILASVLWNFDLELCPESKDWTNQKVYVLYNKPELWVRFKPVQA